MPCPLNTERYSPVKSEFTRPRVRSSSSLTCRSTSGGTAGDTPLAGPTTTRTASDGRAATGSATRATDPDGRTMNAPDGRAAAGVAGGGAERRNHENATVRLREAQPRRDRASRALDLGEHALNDLVARHVLGLGLVRREHAVPQHVGADRLDVVRRDEGASAQERVRL